MQDRGNSGPTKPSVNPYSRATQSHLWPIERLCSAKSICKEMKVIEDELDAAVNDAVLKVSHAFYYITAMHLDMYIPYTSWLA